MDRSIHLSSPRPRRHLRQRCLDKGGALSGEQFGTKRSCYEAGQRIGNGVGDEKRTGQILDPDPARNCCVIAETHPIRFIDPPMSGDRQPRCRGVGDHHRRLDADLLHRPRPRRLDHKVGGTDKPLQETNVGPIVEVHGEHFLPTVHQIEERCGPEPCPIRTVPTLNLDDARAGARENRSGKWPCPQRREIDDEWAGVRRADRTTNQRSLRHSARALLVGSGDRHSQQPAPIDKINRRSRRDECAHRAPILGIDVGLQQCR